MNGKKEERRIYNLTFDEVFREFDSSEKGLSEKDAKERLKEFGKNKLEKKRKNICGKVTGGKVWMLVRSRPGGA